MQNHPLISVLFLIFFLLESSSAENELLFQKSILLENQNLGEIKVRHTEEPADVVYRFDMKYKIGFDNRQKILNEICQQIQCTRSKALIWSTSILRSNTTQVDEIGIFHLYEGLEPVDSIHKFVKAHNLTIDYRYAILEKACKITECKRLEPGRNIFQLILSKIKP